MHKPSPAKHHTRTDRSAITLACAFDASYSSSMARRNVPLRNRFLLPVAPALTELSSVVPMSSSEVKSSRLFLLVPPLLLALTLFLPALLVCCLVLVALPLALLMAVTFFALALLLLLLRDEVVAPNDSFFVVAGAASDPVGFPLPVLGLGLGLEEAAIE
jgi:hypothetical protein